ncbi:MAG: RsmD family RNA methyltransferase [Bacteroidaceae bacterium]
MRVITGKYKGRRFDVPRTFKARPTTDFAKENLFNVLNGYLDFEESTALDLFAGTGSITLELLSRGCTRVVSVELEQQHFSFITSVLRKLEDKAVLPLRTDALRFISRCREQYDLVFADPPYVMNELPELPDRIFAGHLLKEGGLFVLEHGKEHHFSEHPHFLEHRSYGSVNFSFFR